MIHFMTDLVWVGNTLYPRWFVFAAFLAVAFCFITAVGIVMALVIELIDLAVKFIRGRRS